MSTDSNNSDATRPPATTRIWVLAVCHFVLLVCAFALPRVAAKPEQGMAAAATAALVFLACFAVATVLAVVALVQTWIHRRNLSWLTCAAGVLPLVLTVFAVLGIIAFIMTRSA